MLELPMIWKCNPLKHFAGNVSSVFFYRYLVFSVTLITYLYSKVKNDAFSALTLHDTLSLLVGC